MNLFINFNNLLKFILFLNFFIYPILIIKRNKKNNIIVKNCNFKITRLKLIFKHNIEEIIESRYIFPKVRSRETRRIFPDWCLCVKERDRETHKEYWSKASETVPSLLFESNRVESNRIMAPEGNKFWPIIHRLSDRNWSQLLQTLTDNWHSRSNCSFGISIYRQFYFLLEIHAIGSDTYIDILLNGEIYTISNYM